MGDEVDILIDGQFDVLAVALSKRRQGDMHARHVDTLMRTQETIVLHLCDDSRAVDADDEHVESTVVEEHMVALVDVGSEVRVREVDDIMAGVHLRTAEDLHYITRLILYRLRTTRGAHLGALGVDEDADMTAHRADITYYRLYTFLRGMSGVHTNNVHACVEQRTDKVRVTTPVADGSYYLGLFHQPPKLSYMIDSGSTPRESSMDTTAADIGPGPHM